MIDIHDNIFSQIYFLGENWGHNSKKKSKEF